MIGCLVAADAFWRTATSEAAYASLKPLARAAVDAARKFRQRLSSVKALVHLRRALPVDDARAIGITVLRADGGGNVATGVLDLPPLDHGILSPPKSKAARTSPLCVTFAMHRACLAHVHAAFDDLSTTASKLLLLPQRLAMAFDLVDAMDKGHPYGVHLSGPNGVGKSAIGLLAFLLCAARGKPAVYISRSAAWVRAAHEPGGGDAFLLKTFWLQNADLVLDNPHLRVVFRAVLEDEPRPFSREMMDALRGVARTPALPGMAVIADETQHITRAVQDAKASSTRTVGGATASEYFATSWYIWATADDVFQRMTMASAHSERDRSLPDGEASRLRFIEPLGEQDRNVLLERPESPAYVVDPDTREVVTFIAGGILRKLCDAAARLPPGVPTSNELRLLRQHMRDAMIRDSSKWLESLPLQARDSPARTVMDLIAGKVMWGSATVLYDMGIVYRTAESAYVRPISTEASSVLLHVTSVLVTQKSESLAIFADGRRRGFAFEDQVLGRLTCYAGDRLIESKLLNGDKSTGLDLRSNYALPFDHLPDVHMDDVPILYRPTSGNFSCDAILMPASTDSEAPIYCIECSTSDPLLPTRIEKVRKWFISGGLVSALGAAHKRHIIVVLCYDKVTYECTSNLSDDAIALSEGRPPSALAAGAASASTSGSSHAAAGVAPSSTTSKSKGKKRQPSTPHASQRVGDVVRVVDGAALTVSIGLIL